MCPVEPDTVLHPTDCAWERATKGVILFVGAMMMLAAQSAPSRTAQTVWDQGKRTRNPMRPA